MRTWPTKLPAIFMRWAKDLEIQGLILASFVIIGAFTVGQLLQAGHEALLAYMNPRPSPAIAIIRAKPVLIYAPEMIREGVTGIVVSPAGIDPLEPLPETASDLPQDGHELIPTPQATPLRQRRQQRSGRAPYIAGKITPQKWSTRESL
jgi:hypothetical protein